MYIRWMIRNFVIWGSVGLECGLQSLSLGGARVGLCGSGDWGMEFFDAGFGGAANHLVWCPRLGVLQRPSGVQAPKSQVCFTDHDVLTLCTTNWRLSELQLYNL